MTDVFRTLGKFWVANLTAALGFVVGAIGFPVLLGLIAGLPFVPVSIIELARFSMYAGIVVASIGWGWVMTK